jgi:hypothetical protein
MKPLRVIELVIVQLLAGILVDGGCGGLAPLPASAALDGASSDTSFPDTSLAGMSIDSAGNTDYAFSSVDVASDHPVVDASGIPAVDASAKSPLDSGGKVPADASAIDGPASDARAIDAPAKDVPVVLVCPSGYEDCNGDSTDGCETSITTAQHCGGCKNSCGSVANGSPACVNGKCAVKCTAPYQDCDGKYENGCEIPVGQANACDRGGLAAFSGSTPPCGTPYCGSATASAAVANFGSWYCRFCDHCYLFGNGGSYCLYSDTVSNGNGNFSGDRCSTCCAAGDSQVCPR